MQDLLEMTAEGDRDGMFFDSMIMLISLRYQPGTREWNDAADYMVDRKL